MTKSFFVSLVLALSMSTALPSARAAGTTPTTVDAVKVSNKVSFVVWSEDDWGNDSFYQADALHDTVVETLKQMGASNIQVQVEGEPDELVQNPMVWGTFDSVRVPSAHLSGAPLTASWRQVTLQGSDNGLAVKRVLEGVQSYFEIRNLQGSAGGAIGEGNPYRYTFTTLMAQ